MLGFILVIAGQMITDYRLKQLEVEESLNQQQIEQLNAKQLVLEKHINQVASVVDPEFMRAIRQFTNEVETENNYLKSFTPSTNSTITNSK